MVRNVFIVLGILAFLGIGGRVTVVGAIGNERSKSVDADAEKNAPREITTGMAFYIGKHETQAGWKAARVFARRQRLRRRKRSRSATLDPPRHPSARLMCPARQC
ncbi:hypothetical protein OG555_05355 [Kribbella sp. NBC_01484]|uniref:hypothetical protein n=1 Tax=Kribbella sp. NBC_01484 TaxID=2903579 RepID=UPI002E355FAA|nr:hypothetical protein [Kribbella sp. NBC_01484]